MAPSSDSTTRIAMFPSPGMGHLIPFVELAKLLLHRRHISSATLILPSTTSTASSTLLQSLPDSIRLHHLPPITPDNHQTPESEIFRSIALSLDSACVALADLAGSPLAALVVDPFGLDLLDAAKKLDVPAFMYFGTAAMNLLFTFRLPEFEKMLAGNDDKEFEDSPDPFILPGCPPLHGRDFGDPFKSRKSPVYKRFLQQSEKSKSVDGILVNTFMNLESGAISALKQAEQPPVYPIGPIVGAGQDGRLSGPVVDWLDGQPVRSVLYVSFGSGGTLSYEQTSELALGLEESGLRFLWVVRPPNDANSCPAYVGGGDLGADPIEFLPEGFVERTRGRALVVPNWAPQVAVLAHGSTGGFLTHCGWNSALESVMHGVPMIAWPLYAEQRTNAVALAEGLGVAVRPALEGGGVVVREEVVRVVRMVMEEAGGLRERAKELKEEAQEALGEGGSSTSALCEFGARLNQGVGLVKH